MHWRRKWQPAPVFLPGESHGWGIPPQLEKNDVVPTSSQDEALARDGVSREVPCSVLKWETQKRQCALRCFVVRKVRAFVIIPNITNAWRVKSESLSPTGAGCISASDNFPGANSIRLWIFLPTCITQGSASVSPHGV